MRLLRLVGLLADFAKVDKWVHRRLRAVRWKEWKAYKGRRRHLVALGIPEYLAHQWAASQRGAWRLAASPPLQRALPGTYWARLGLQGFAYHWHRLRAVW